MAHTTQRVRLNLYPNPHIYFLAVIQSHLNLAIKSTAIETRTTHPNQHLQTYVLTHLHPLTITLNLNPNANFSFNPHSI